MAPQPTVVAHRGVHTGDVTENTMEAFELAVSSGAEMVEFDVRRTAAGELVILHDHAQGGVALDSCSLDEFERRTGFRPPLLTQVLEWADGRIALDVELKEDGYVDDVAPLLLDFAAAGNPMIVTSFVDPVLARLSEIAPGLKLGLLLSWTAANASQRAETVGAAIVVPEMKLITEAVVADITQGDRELIIWDFMAEKDSQWLADPRVGAVITDDVPGALRTRLSH